MARPALGKVAVGDELLVIRPFNRYRDDNDPVRVRVVKAARVWIDLEEIDQVSSYARTWRMRLDTQNEGSKYTQQDRFVTAEQYAYETRVDAADAYLCEVKVRSDYGSLWNAPERRIVLANLLRAHEGLPEI